MTLRELSEHFQLRSTLLRNEELLDALRLAAAPRSPSFDGMPHTSGVSDKVGDLATEIADLERCTNELRRIIDTKEHEIEAYIVGIDDGYLRTIFRLRFIRCLTWGEVAAAVGGHNTEQGVKTAVYRYLKLQRCVTT